MVYNMYRICRIHFDLLLHNMAIDFIKTDLTDDMNKHDNFLLKPLTLKPPQNIVSQDLIKFTRRKEIHMMQNCIIKRSIIIKMCTKRKIERP